MRIQVVGYVVGLSRKRVKGDANKERNGGVSMSRGQYRQKYATEEVRLFICECIDKEWPKSRIAKALNLNIHTFDRLLAYFEIEYHGNQNGTSKFPLQRETYIPLDIYLQETPSPKTTIIKRKLLEEGYKDAVCENCGRREWMNGPIPLELHHRDGNHANVSLDNFQLLCPNCHALTPNYRSKGQLTQDELDQRESDLDIIHNGCSNQLIDKYEQKQTSTIASKKVRHSDLAAKHRKKCCPICGALIWDTSELCRNCSHKAQYKCEHPNKEQLLQLIFEYPMLQIGKMYGVSDNSVRKWCQKYGLPYRYAEIQKMKKEYYNK